MATNFPIIKELIPTDPFEQQQEEQIPEPDLSDYFAQTDKDNIAAELMERVEDYHRAVMANGIYALWGRSYQKYYSGFTSLGRVMRKGPQGQYITSSINHYKSLLQTIHTLTTQQEIAFEAQSLNNDYESDSQTIIANQLLEFCRKTKNVQTMINRATEFSTWAGEGFVRVGWDPTRGQKLDPPTDPTTGQPVAGAPRYVGDLVCDAFHPYDVIRDWTLDSNDQSNWVIVRSLKSKWDLAAKYPEYAEDIISLTRQNSLSSDTMVRFDEESSYRAINSKHNDYIYLYEFYHKPTEALPMGRYVSFLTSEICLDDMKLQYPEVSVYRIAGGDKYGSIFGNTIGYDLLPLQEGVDTNYSIILTNQITHGVSHLAVPHGSNISIHQLAKGLQVIKYDKQQGLPQPINFTATATEIFTMLTNTISGMETISGVNSVARGNVPMSGKMSGSAMALLHTMASQYNSNLQQSYVALVEQVGNAIIKLYQTYATEPQLIPIVGEANARMLESFTGADLKQVQRVDVDVANPITQHISGRMELARGLVEIGAQIEPEDFMHLMSTGRLEPILARPRSQKMLIAAENARLQSGIPQHVELTDLHSDHMRAHSVIVDSPQLREAAANKDPEALAVLQAVTKHIQDHWLALSGGVAPPGMLAIFGEQAQQPAPMGAGAPAGASPAPEATGMTNTKAADDAGVNQPTLPSGPVNPLTGQEANVKLPKGNVQ